MKKLKFLDIVEDTISGAKGKIVGRIEYVYELPKIGIQSSVNTDGTIPTIQWFNEKQLKLITPSTKNSNTLGFNKGG